MSCKLRGRRFEEQMENNAIIAGHMATLNRLREEMVAREELKRAQEIERKKAWQLREIARVEAAERGGHESSDERNLNCYGGYLDGYTGKTL